MAKHTTRTRKCLNSGSGRWSFGSLLAAAMILAGLLTLALPVSAQGIDFIGGVGGNLEDAEVIGDYAFVGTETGLTVLDISDPAAPRQVVSIPIEGGLAAVTSQGTMLYGVSGGYTLFGIFAVVDVSDPVNPRVLARADLGYWVGENHYNRYGFDMAVQGDYAYVTAGYDGLLVVDISSPSAPTVVGNLVMDGGWVAVSGDHAFVGGQYGWYVVDVADPTLPVIVHTDGRRAGEMIVIGSYLYVWAVYENSILIFDVSDPHAPVEVGAISSLGHMYYDQASNRLYTYVLDQGLCVFDVSEPSAPFLLGGTAGVEGGVVSTRGTIIFLTTAGEGSVGSGGWLRTADATDPNAIRALGEYMAETADVVGCGSLAYALIYTPNTPDDPSWLAVYDVADPGAVREVGRVPFGDGGARALAVEGTRAYVTEPGLTTVVDLSDPIHPIVAGTLGEGGHVVRSLGDYVYVGDAGSLKIIDVRDPAAPQLVGVYDIPPEYPTGIHTLAVQGAYVYLVYGYYPIRLAVIDISNPTAPTEVSCYPLPAEWVWAPTVEVEGSRCYLTADPTVLVLDVSDPLAIHEVARYDVPLPYVTWTLTWDSLIAWGHQLYGVAGCVLRTIRNEDPLTPEQIGVYLGHHCWYAWYGPLDLDFPRLYATDEFQLGVNVFHVPGWGGPPFLSGVWPSSAENSGYHRLIAYGGALRPGATLRLVHQGTGAIIPGQGPTVSDSNVTAVFDLEGVPVGLWDLVAMNPDGQQAMLVGGFQTTGAEQTCTWTVGDVTVTFEEVTVEGTTTIIVSDPPPAPAPEPLTFLQDCVYHIATTAEISGSMTVAVDYNDTNYPPVLGERLSLLLWDGSQWVDITTRPVDTANYAIRGEFTPGAERDWFVALALERPPVPKVKVMFEGCTEGRPAGLALFVADADLRNLARLTLPPIVAGACGQVGSVWSPDGTKVAMARPQSEVLGVIQVLDLTALLQVPSQEAHVLLDELGQPVHGYFPAWSPSGDKLVYGYGGGLYPPGLESINAVNADGTGAHAIYTFPESFADAFRYPDWSPDGSRTVFGLDRVVRKDGDLYLLENLDAPGGATLRPLTVGTPYHHDAPHWSPDGTRIVFTRSPRGVGNWWGSDIWVMDVDTGTETQLTHTSEITKMATGWCQFDGYIYFTSGGGLNRVLPDGTGEEVVAAQLSPMTWALERFSWAPTGVWMDGVSVFPGEAVTSKMGIVDAEDLAGVQAKILYGSLGMYSADLGDSIFDWVMPSPVIQPGKASLLAYASDPGNQNVWGPAHLFDLTMLNPPSAFPGETRLMTFDSLLLSDEWGDPLDRVSFSGGIHTIPFADLQVSDIAGPVGADPIDPMPVTVTVTALDRLGWTMPDSEATIELNTFDWQSWGETKNMLRPVTPTSAAMAAGEWSGQVMLSEPRPSVRLLAHWEDIGGYSNWFQAIGKGDANADNRVSIFDVIKIANMAIGRGTWADWQWWAADLNRDQEVNVFDVVICANRAMGLMSQRLAVGRAAAAPAGSVTVTTTTTTVGTQMTVAVELSDCAGLAGVQVDLKYDAHKLSYASMSRGAFLSGKSSWAALDNDLGGTLRAIAYTASGEVLPGGKGAILTFTFNRAGKGVDKIELTSVKLADAEGSEIACQVGRNKPGGKSK